MGTRSRACQGMEQEAAWHPGRGAETCRLQGWGVPLQLWPSRRVGRSVRGVLAGRAAHERRPGQLGGLEPRGRAFRVQGKDANGQGHSAAMGSAGHG